MNLGITSVVAAVSVVFLLRGFREIRDWPTRYLIFIIWLRYALAAYHEHTYDPIAAGLSINALSSIAVVGGGILLIPRSLFSLRFLAPLYLLTGIIACSGVLNKAPIDLLDALTKWGYFGVIATLTYQALKRYNRSMLLSALGSAFILPVTLQVISIALGAGKATESDGSVSFIGGYNHEAVFSTIILTFILVSYLREGGRWIGPLSVGLGVMGLIWANYRTTMIAAAPMVGAYALFRSVNSVVPHQRRLIAIFAAVAVAAGFAAAGVALQERFFDIWLALSAGSDLIKPPYYYTDPERDLFSARLYLWSQYIHAFLQGDALTQALGYGPNSWEAKFTTYAHNTFVSFLYEYGYAGLVGLVFVLVSGCMRALSVPIRQSKALLGAGHIGFLLVNLATMPLWTIEGFIFYGLLTGVTWNASVKATAKTRGSTVPLGALELSIGPPR